MREKTRGIVPHQGAKVISEDLLIDVDSPHFIGMATVRVAIADRDLAKLALHLNELPAAKVELKNFAPGVKTPDRVILHQVAAAHGNLCELSCHLDEFRLGGIETKDLLRSVNTPDLRSAGSDRCERACDLIELLCRCGDDNGGPATGRSSQKQYPTIHIFLFSF